MTSSKRRARGPGVTVHSIARDRAGLEADAIRQARDFFGPGVKLEVDPYYEVTDNVSDWDHGYRIKSVERPELHERYNSRSGIVVRPVSSVSDGATVTITEAYGMTRRQVRHLAARIIRAVNARRSR